MACLDRTCEGGCCAVFFYHGPEEAVSDDQKFIADMLIPLTIEEAKARLERFGLDPRPSLDDDERWEGRAFTCRHWDEESRLCTVYSQRPKMCRDFPYDKDCEDCDYKPSQTVIDEWKKIHAEAA